MLPLRPEYLPFEKLPTEKVLSAIVFGGTAPAAVPLGVTIAMSQLGGQRLVEVWRTNDRVRQGHCGPIVWSRTADVMFGALAFDAGPTEVITAEAYQSIVDCVTLNGMPNLLRVWNHLGGINEDERELERYKRFSAGRHDAFTTSGYSREAFPAASAVGMSAPGLAIYFVASKSAALQVENPRQVAAYLYPPCYGPKSPSFSRSAIAQWGQSAMIFVSGTSSVVGHESKHAGDIDAQFDETLRNLDAVIAESASRAGRKAGAADLTTAKTYLRRATDYDHIHKRLAAALPRTQLLFLESDICRKDLLIEIEGVVALD
jgi:chorismate lyase/3-hydroxybenzoate synthase